MKLYKENIYGNLKHARSIIDRFRTKENIRLPVVIKDRARDFLKDYLDHQIDTDETNLIKLTLLAVDKGDEVTIYIYPSISDVKTNNCLLVEDSVYNLSQIITTLEAEYNHR